MSDKILTEALDRIRAIEEGRKYAALQGYLHVGDYVEGIQGVDGGKRGTITKIGAPFNSSGTAKTVYVEGDDGEEWDTYDFNLKKVPRPAISTTSSLEESSDDERLIDHLNELEDGLEELVAIQEEYAELNNRLADAIRSYTPDRYNYWRSYGLAQLAIITQGGNSGFASNDESIDHLIEELEEEIEETRYEIQDREHTKRINDDVDDGSPIYRK